TTTACDERRRLRRQSSERCAWLDIIRKSGTFLELYLCSSVEPTMPFANSKRLQGLTQRSQIRIVSSLSYMKKRETKISREGNGRSTSCWLTRGRRRPKPPGLIAREISCS